eukprot:5456688-Pyramimonas_sp.AAC.1
MISNASRRPGRRGMGRRMQSEGKCVKLERLRKENAQRRQQEREQAFGAQSVPDATSSAGDNLAHHQLGFSN